MRCSEPASRGFAHPVVGGRPCGFGWRRRSRAGCSYLQEPRRQVPRNQARSQEPHRPAARRPSRRSERAGSNSATTSTTPRPLPPSRKRLPPTRTTPPATAWRPAIDLDHAAVRAGSDHRRGLPRPGAGQRAAIGAEGRARRAFHEYLRQAQMLSEQRLRDHPADADAHYQVGAAFGFLASYTATVEGRVLGSLGAARRAYPNMNGCSSSTPQRKDAGLIVGMYRYAVSELSAPLRLLARLAGFGGGRERRAAPDRRSRALSERRPGERALHAHPLVQPRGPLRRRARRDSASCRRAIRATGCSGSRPAARRCERNDRPRRSASLEEGLARLASDPRPRAPGEEARWRYAYGAALVALKDVRPPNANFAPRWPARRATGSADACTRSWASWPIWPAIARARSNEYRRPTASAARTRDSACRRSEGVAKTAYR